MDFLVADVGGTNTRIARTRDGGIVAESLAYLRNDGFAGFEALLADYLASHPGAAPRACCIALAGPIEDGAAQMTNRDWRIEAAAISRALGGAEVRLLNDLAALGHAIGTGATGGLRLLSGLAAPEGVALQRLVVGLGTGFNVAPVLQDRAGRAHVMSAEAGHAHLPANVAALLSERLGATQAARFSLVEDCFSGDGLARLHGMLHGRDLAPSDIASAAREGGDGGAAADTVATFTTLLGALLANLLLQHMPRGGLYLAGSVARAVIEAGGADRLARATRNVPRYGALFETVPIWLIEEDAAALRGCLAHLGDIDATAGRG